MIRRNLLRAGAFTVAGSMFTFLSAGCSSKKGTSRAKKVDKRDPTRFGSMLMDSYINDLKKGPATKQITAANELANMGSKAKSALPHLEKLSKNPDATVSVAAKNAIVAIKKGK